MTQRFARARILMEAEVDEELVALDPDDGVCFGFNGAATSIWRLLAQPRSEEELVAALTNEFEVAPEQCRADVRELLDDLVARGLLTREDG